MLGNLSQHLLGWAAPLLIAPLTFFLSEWAQHARGRLSYWLNAQPAAIKQAAVYAIALALNWVAQFSPSPICDGSCSVESLDIKAAISWGVALAIHGAIKKRKG